MCFFFFTAKFCSPWLASCLVYVVVAAFVDAFSHRSLKNREESLARKENEPEKKDDWLEEKSEPAMKSDISMS